MVLAAAVFAGAVSARVLAVKRVIFQGDYVSERTVLTTHSVSSGASV
jgi:hypothetical protein